MRLGLASLCALLVDELRADACAISRVLGDVLIQVGEHVPAGGTLNTGQGYLASDFPLTVDVAARCGGAAGVDAGPAGGRRARRACCTRSATRACSCSRSCCRAAVWGLVEVYRRGSGFSDEEAAAGERILGEAVAAAAA